MRLGKPHLPQLFFITYDLIYQDLVRTGESPLDIPFACLKRRAMSEAAFDYSALAKLSERQQMKFLLSITSSAGRAPLADRKANVDFQPVAVSKPAKAVLTPVLVCADDDDLGGDSDVKLALIDPLLMSDEERCALKGFKAIADELLPYMRRCSLCQCTCSATHTSAAPLLTDPAS